MTVLHDIYTALKAEPERWFTLDELSNQLVRAYPSVSTRVNELVEGGYADLELEQRPRDMVGGRRRLTVRYAAQQPLMPLPPQKKRGRRPMPYDTEHADRMLAAYVHDDMTLEEVGALHGLTRERVRQIIQRHDPTLVKLALRRRKARTRLRRLVDRGGTTHVKTCPVCGVTFETKQPGGVYCTVTHQRIRILLRYQTDEDFHEKQAIATSKWAVANPDKIPVAQVRNAERILAGESTSPDHHRSGTRYLIPGSLPFHWACRAYALDWPIFDRLHPDVQQQVREYVDAP